MGNPAVPVTGGPEGGQGNGASLLTVLQVTHEGFSPELLRAVQCLVQFLCFVLSLTCGRQTVFLSFALRV